MVEVAESADVVVLEETASEDEAEATAAHAGELVLSQHMH